MLDLIQNLEIFCRFGPASFFSRNSAENLMPKSLIFFYLMKKRKQNLKDTVKSDEKSNEKSNDQKSGIKNFSAA